MDGSLPLDQPRQRQAEPGVEPRDPTSTLRCGVKALVSDGDAYLLTKEKRADGSTFWTLPGGGVRPQESLEEGLRRELEEELCCEIRISERIARCWYRHTQVDEVTAYTVFSGTLVTSPEANQAEGIIDYEWVDPTEPPPGTLTTFSQLLRALD